VLALPTFYFDPAADRRYARRLLQGLCLFGLPLWFLQHAPYFGLPLALHLSAAIAVAAVFFFAAAYMHWLPLVDRLPRALVLGGVAAYFLLNELEPRLLLGVALAGAVFVADSFATHIYWIRTANPEFGFTAKRRMAWRNRWNPFQPQAPGLEFYWLGAPLVAFAFLFYLHHEVQLPTGQMLEHLPAFGWLLMALLLIPFVLEPLICLIFRRRYITPLSQFNAFRRAVVLWLTYNRHQAAGPGILQSPAGTHRERTGVFYTLAILFAAAVVPQFNQQRDEVARSAMAAAEAAEAQAAAARREAATAARGRTARSAEAVPAEDTASMPIPGADGLSLDERQRRLLERMDAPALQRYLDQLRQRDQSRQRIEDLFAAENAARAKHAEVRQQGDELFGTVRAHVVSTSTALVYPGLSMLLPVLLLLAGIFTVAAPAVVIGDPGFGAPEQEVEISELTTTWWDLLVAWLQSSSNPIERESLFLGMNAADRSPVIVPREVFQEHAHLLGDSGSGKTSLGLAPLISQLIRFGDCSVVVVDLKADDLALLEGVRREARAADLRFRWFTNELRRPTYAFNPLLQSHYSELSLYQRTDVLTSALGLQYGTDYGRGYFSDANAELLHRALKVRPDARSFAELAEVLADPRTLRGVSRELRRAGSHLETVINRLASHEPMNVTPDGRYPESVVGSAIDMSQLFRVPQVVVFHLASALGTATSAEMGRLALHSLLTAAKSVGPNRVQVYLFIDEFQRLIAGNLELFLQTARSMNIGVILANQTLMDLKTPGVDLIPTVRANTRFKQVFAASDLQEQQELVQSSGETIVHNRGWTEYLGIGNIYGGIRSMTSTETVTPRLRPNDILLATDDPKQCIVQVRRGAGYAQYGGMPFVMVATHHITRDEYETRRQAPWPNVPGETLIAQSDADRPVQAPPPSPATPREQHAPPEQAPVEHPDPVLDWPSSQQADSPPAEVSSPPESGPDPFDELWRQQQSRRRRGRGSGPSPPSPETPEQETEQ
jgi:hypothetical protein